MRWQVEVGEGGGQQNGPLAGPRSCRDRNSAQYVLSWYVPSIAGTDDSLRGQGR